MIDTLKEFVRMSRVAGSRVDYVQAGGGNTSVKFDDGYMAIKASGYGLKDMTEQLGFVVVDGKEMKEYHESEGRESEDFNKEASEIAIASIKQINGEIKTRPSVEVGFHSVLDKYVLHLHPVYTNVLMCSKGGVERALEIAKAKGISCIGVPYIQPGYFLTRLILKTINECEKSHEEIPKVIFLKNHGVITHAQTATETQQLMDDVNSAIIDALKLPDFPEPKLEKEGKGYKSSNEWLINVLTKMDIASQMINNPIYPDQLVYTANELCIGKGKGKISVFDRMVFYNVGEKEAAALEDTMTALAYLYYCISEKGFDMELLSSSDCAAILGWDSEKYRKSLLSDDYAKDERNE